MANNAENNDLKPWSVRKNVNEALKSRDLPDLDEEEDLNEEEADEVESGITVDVFDFCHGLVEKGEIVSYDIMKNSQFIGKKTHPYSWLEIQREFGPGHYRVVAKSERTKKYLKQQTNYVAEHVKQDSEDVVSKIRSIMPPKEDSFEQMSKMATLMKSLTPPPPPDNTSQVLMQMMQMQQTSQAATQTMILEMQKNNQAMIEKLADTQRQMVEKLEAKLTTGKSTTDPLEILSLVQKAEDRGMKNYLLLEEMAEKRAARMNPSKDEDKEPESMTDRLIKTALPLVAAAAERSKAPPPVQGQVPRQMLRPLATAKPQPQGPRPQAAPVPPKPTVVVGPRPQAPAPKPAPRAVVLASKEELISKIVPILGDKLIAGSLNPSLVVELDRQAVEETMSYLKESNTPLDHLLQTVKENDMIEIAKGYGLPEEANSWLRSYYANLQALRAKIDSSKAKTEGGQQNHP